MVVRSRLRKIVLSLALYAFSAGVVTYFVRHASMGDRGLKAKEAYKEQIRELRTELAEARTEREGIELRVRQFQSESVDRDLLDEEARRVLGRAHRNELILTLPTPQG